jgi:hypothetical protein
MNIFKKRPHGHLVVAPILLDDETKQMLYSMGASIRDSRAIQCMTPEIRESAEILLESRKIPATFQEDYRDERMEFPPSFYQRMVDFNRYAAPVAYSESAIMTETVLNDARRLRNWFTKAGMEVEDG